MTTETTTPTNKGRSVYTYKSKEGPRFICLPDEYVESRKLTYYKRVRPIALGQGINQKTGEDVEYVEPEPAMRSRATFWNTTIREKSTWAEAQLTAPNVSLEILQERVETCSTCRYRDQDKDGIFCGICGCGLSREMKDPANLARKEEGPIQPDGRPKWGCKYPAKKRAAGEGGWKR